MRASARAVPIPFDDGISAAWNARRFQRSSYAKRSDGPCSTRPSSVSGPMLHFDRFRFDGANQRLEEPEGVIRLNPKAFEVLRVLIERPGQLVLKDQLLDQVWPDTHVADGVLKVCMDCRTQHTRRPDRCR